jgi:hypothetical protein
MEQTNQITDGITSGIEARKQRGLEIAALARIDKDNGGYLVPSVTSPRKTKYRVSLDGDKFSCTCPDYETRGCRCKHVYAVEYTLKREQSVTVESDGSATITETVTVTKTRKTYPQNWPAYNEAQQNEKRDFQRLLHDLCKDWARATTHPNAGCDILRRVQNLLHVERPSLHFGYVRCSSQRLHREGAAFQQRIECAGKSRYLPDPAVTD